MIDQAIAEDRDAVVALWAAAGLTRPWNPPARDFADALAGATSTILVARGGAAIAGTVMVGHDGHRGWLYFLAVAPDRRRAGLGARLVAAAEDWLRARGSPKAQIMLRGDNAAARRFYAALGFERQDVIVLGRFLDGADARAG